MFHHKNFSPDLLLRRASVLFASRSNWRSIGTLLVAVIAIFWFAGCAETPSAYTNVTHFTTVVIDAGHGGHDSGCISRGGSVIRTTHIKHRKRVVTTTTIPGVHVLEKDLALDMARRVSSKLGAAGLHVVMTRRDDTFIPLETRAAISNAQHDSIFVSIHFNDTFRRGIHGMETYQNNKGTDELAHRIERAISTCPGGVSRGVMHANYHVLRNSRGPAVLIECGYLSNADEASRCASATYREQLASRIAQAILDQRR